MNKGSYSPGDFVFFELRVKDYEILSGSGLIVEEADIDSDSVNNSWVVYSEGEFFIVDESNMYKRPAT